MEIQDIIAGRNEALRLVEVECHKAATVTAFTWDKLDRVRSYLKKSTIEEANSHFAQETDHERAERELGPF